MRGRYRKLLPVLIRTAVIALVLVLWDMTVRWGWVDPLFLAGPVATLARLGSVIRAAAPDLYATVTSFAAAYLAGVLAALALGFWIHLSEYATKVLTPVLAMGVTVPKVALIPLFVLWFGIGTTPIIVFGALSGFFPMIVNVVTAAAEVKQNQIWLAKAMGYGRFQIYRKVIFPAMLPVLSSGLFYACNASMMGVFIVELSLARNGLGAFVHDLAMTFQTADLYAAVFLTASIAVAVNMALWYTARYFGRWRL
jgi:ABC-type nitrate/sulfonate/bicarbonate transport system permease component